MDFKLTLKVIPALVIPVIGTFITNAPAIWPISVLLYNVGLLYIFATATRFKLRLAAYNLFSSLFFLTETAFFLSYYIQNHGFNDAFFYHISADLLYAGTSEYIVLISPAIACLAVLLYLASSFIKKSPYRDSTIKYLYAGLIITGLAISPPVKDIAVHAGAYFQAESDGHRYDFFPELLGPRVTAKPGITGKPNIVLIYAESLEQRYFDDAVFPKLLPKLSELREKSIHFSNVAQGIGAAYTIAGLVASQCSYPLSMNHDVGDSIFGEFLPNATCLGDILKGEGYHLTFVGGADPRFGGKDDFLLSHGYIENIGRDTLLGTLQDRTYRHDWGAFDDTLFNFAIDKFSELSSNKSPFLLTLLTLGTHNYDGFMSASCGTYQEIDNSYLNSVHCTDQLISRFIGQIRDSVFSDNTIVAVVSDHLALRNSTEHLLENSSMKKRLTFFVNMPNGTSEVVTHPGVTYDIAPTILDLAGFTIEGQMGFGAPLSRGAGYLPGKFGEDGWKSMADQLNAIGRTLRDDSVNLDRQGIHFAISNLSLRMGGKTFDLRLYDTSTMNYLKIPISTLFVFDPKTLELEKMQSYSIYKGYKPGALARDIMENQQKLVFVIGPAGELPGSNDPGISPTACSYYLGKPGSDAFAFERITNDIKIPYESIIRLSMNESSQH